MATLAGQRVVVTRAAHQSREMAEPLQQLGAEVILLPLLTIAPPTDPAPLEEAARQIAKFDWLIFTSANAVRAFQAALPPHSDLSRVSVAAVGPATRNAALAAGFRTSVMPSIYQAEALIEALSSGPLDGVRILLPASDLASDTVPEELRHRGAQVQAVEAYRNICPPEAAAQAAQIFHSPYPDWVLFASPSAVRNLVSLVGVETIGHCRIASIGAVTSAAIGDAGLTVAVQADPQTVSGLVKAVAGFGRTPPPAAAQ